MNEAERFKGNTTAETARRYVAQRSRSTPDGCIVWTRSYRGRGYGQAWYQGKAIGAHVLAYLAFVGPLQRGQVVRHTCDNPPCVNPAHLLSGITRDNLLDMTSKGRHANQCKTHCKNNHEFTPENTRISATHGRVCRACSTAASRRYQQRKRDHRE